MAVQSPVYHPTPSQYAAAAMHLDNRDEWRYVRIAGQRYVALASGTSNHLYLVRADARGCACAWYQKTGQPCSHMLAVELAALEDELRESAEAVPAVPAAPAPKGRASYEDVFGVCDERFCDADREPGERFCARHALVDAF